MMHHDSRCTLLWVDLERLTQMNSKFFRLKKIKDHFCIFQSRTCWVAKRVATPMIALHLYITKTMSFMFSDAKVKSYLFMHDLC